MAAVSTAKAALPCQIRRSLTTRLRTGSLIGAVGSYGAGQLYFVTIARNSAGPGTTSAYQAGGIYSTNISLRNSIVAGNSGYQDAPQVQGSFTSLGYNLIENTAGSSGWTGADKQNMPRVSRRSETSAVLLKRSLCCPEARPSTRRIRSTFPPTDQRGRTRPVDGDGDGNGVARHRLRSNATGGSIRRSAAGIRF